MDLKQNLTGPKMRRSPRQIGEMAAIMKSFGQAKEGSVVTIDFVDDVDGDRPRRHGARNDRRRGVQRRAHADLARRQAGAGRSEEGDARRCLISGVRAGYRLLAHGADGACTVTDDFLRSLPGAARARAGPESCAAELALHEALLAEPRRAVGAAELGAIADADARENYAIWLRFRDRLRRAPIRSRRPTSGCSGAKASTCRRCSSRS